jgi:hypothetical protein
MARILLEHGADPLRPDRFGKSAADDAARHGLDELAALMALSWVLPSTAD